MLCLRMPWLHHMSHTHIMSRAYLLGVASERTRPDVPDALAALWLCVLTTSPRLRLVPYWSTIAPTQYIAVTSLRLQRCGFHDCNTRQNHIFRLISALEKLVKIIQKLNSLCKSISNFYSRIILIKF